MSVTVAEPTQDTERTTLIQVGPLRLGLALLIALCLPLVFFADAQPEGWRVIPVYVGPVLAVIFIWLLLLDMLMSRVLMSEQPPEKRVRYRLAMKLDAALLAAIFLFWGPFFYGLLSG